MQCSVLTPVSVNPRSPLPVQGARGFAQAAEKEVKLPPQHGIAGRYAAALYMAAVKSDTLSKVESELSSVAQLMSESKDFSTFIADPSVPRNTKLDGLDAVLSKMGASEITKNFVGAWDWGNGLGVGKGVRCRRSAGAAATTGMPSGGGAAHACRQRLPAGNAAELLKFSACA